MIRKNINSERYHDESSSEPEISDADRIPTPTYWSTDNHQPNSLLRIENWRTPQISSYCLPSKTPHVIPICINLAKAIIRYHEEVKFFAALDDEKRLRKDPTSTFSVMNDPSFYSQQHERIKQDWVTGERLEFMHELMKFVDNFDEILKREYSSDSSVFIKLASRSPKDAVFGLQKSRDSIESQILKLSSSFLSSSLNCKERLGEDCKIIRHASLFALRINSGEEALQMLLRSDRIYMDLLQAELFKSSKSNDTHANNEVLINMYIFDFFDDLNPDYEFRGFVSKGIKTCLSTYNPYVYDLEIIENKSRILDKILEVWDKIDIEFGALSQNYSLDFAMSNNFQNVYLIEINNFLPPLAGSGLFNYYDDKDRNIIENGPFVFRIKETALEEKDFSTTITLGTGDRKTMVSSPAPPEVLAFIDACRREALGKQSRGDRLYYGNKLDKIKCSIS